MYYLSIFFTRRVNNSSENANLRPWLNLLLHAWINVNLEGGKNHNFSIVTDWLTLFCVPFKHCEAGDGYFRW